MRDHADEGPERGGRRTWDDTGRGGWRGSSRARLRGGEPNRPAAMRGAQQPPRVNAMVRSDRDRCRQSKACTISRYESRPESPQQSDLARIRIDIFGRLRYRSNTVRPAGTPSATAVDVRPDR